MAVCARGFGSDGHAPAGAETNLKLTFHPNHSMGAGQEHVPSYSQSMGTFMCDAATPDFFSRQRIASDVVVPLRTPSTRGRPGGGNRDQLHARVRCLAPGSMAIMARRTRTTTLADIRLREGSVSAGQTLHALLQATRQSRAPHITQLINSLPQRASASKRLETARHTAALAAAAAGRRSTHSGTAGDSDVGAVVLTSCP